MEFHTESSLVSPPLLQLSSPSHRMSHLFLHSLRSTQVVVTAPPLQGVVRRSLSFSSLSNDVAQLSLPVMTAEFGAFPSLPLSPLSSSLAGRPLSPASPPPLTFPASAVLSPALLSRTSPPSSCSSSSSSPSVCSSSSSASHAQSSAPPSRPFPSVATAAPDGRRPTSGEMSEEGSASAEGEPTTPVTPVHRGRGGRLSRRRRRGALTITAQQPLPSMLPSEVTAGAAVDVVDHLRLIQVAFHRLERTVGALTAENERLKRRIAALEAETSISPVTGERKATEQRESDEKANSHRPAESIGSRDPPPTPPLSPPTTPPVEAKTPVEADGEESASLGSGDPLFSILFQRRRKEQQRQQRRRDSEGVKESAVTAEGRPFPEPIPFNGAIEVERQGQAVQDDAMESKKEVESVTELPRAVKRKREEEEEDVHVMKHSGPLTGEEAAPLPQLTLLPEAVPRAVEMADDPLSTQQMTSDSVNDSTNVAFCNVVETRRGAKGSFLLHDYPRALALYDSADAQLTALIPANENHPSALSIIGDEMATVLASRAAIHIKLGDLPSAQSDVDRLKAIRSDWWKTFALQARVLVGERRLQEALDVYQRAMECDITDSDRAKLQQKSDDVDRKQRHMKRGDNQHPASSQLHAPLSQGRSPHRAPSTLLLPSTPSTQSSDGNPSPIRVAQPVVSPAVNRVLDVKDTPPQRPSSPPFPHPHLPTSPLSPSPAKPPSQGYSMLPRITVEGVRDLLGAELFHRAEAAIASVYKIKVTRDLLDNTADPPVHLLAKCKRGEGRRRKRRRGEGGESHPSHLDEGRRGMLDVEVQFRGNRVMEWSCSCSGHQGEEKQGEGEGEWGDRGEGEDEEERDHVDSAFIPCRHVAAVLLLVRNKQVAAHPPSTPSTQPPLYLHPSHMLSAGVVASMPALYEQFASMTVDRLRRLLHANAERQSGVKEELVERCVEGHVRGVLPKCDRCGGSLFYANGQVHCKGGFDRDRKVRLPCEVHLPEDAVQRRPWRGVIGVID